MNKVLRIVTKINLGFFRILGEGAFLSRVHFYDTNPSNACFFFWQIPQNNHTFAFPVDPLDMGTVIYNNPEKSLLSWTTASNFHT